MKLTTNLQVGIVFLILLIWQLLLTFQGLELADTGLNLTSFRFIFDDPYSSQYSMMFWLSDVCGYFWMNILPSGGLFWGRLGWVVIISVALVLYFLLLNPVLGKRKAIFGLAITLIFILQGGPESLNYDIFSILGFAFGVYLLIQGLNKSNIFILLFSGFILGVTVFFKLSNLTGLAFIITIPFSVYQNYGTIAQFFKRTFFWLLGFCAGIISILILIKHTGQLDLFLENISFILEMGKDSKATHGLKPMLLSYLFGYTYAFVGLVVFIVIVLIYNKITNKYQIIYSKKYDIFFYSIALVLTAFLMIVYKEVFWSKIRYLFIGLMIFQGIEILLNRGSDNKLRLISMSGLILLFIAPIGSDSGMVKSVFGMWILGPLVLIKLNFTYFFNLLKIKLYQDQAIFLKRSLSIVIFISAIIFAWQATYMDFGTRLKKTYPIDHPKLKFIYTRYDRAKAINELIHGAFPKIKNEKYLLSFIDIPMINYLADKKPFISTSWPKLYNNPQSFKIKLDEALLLRETYPAIIRQKQNAISNNWLASANPEYLQYPNNLSKCPEHGIILNNFIIKNNYKVIWENEMFQLLIRE